MLIAQLTDLHITAPGTQALGGRVDTALAFSQAVEHLLGMAVTPDALILTGDITDQGEAEEYAHFLTLLAPLSLPILACPGNHDDPARLKAALSPLEAHQGQWSKGPTLDVTLDLGTLRLVGLDTTVPGVPHGMIREHQLAWLDSRLAEAAFIGMPVVLFLHHPPFPTGIAHMDRMGLKNPEGLATVLERHQGQVVRLLCGHIHRHISTQWHGVPAVIGPSPAHAVTLDLDPHAPATFTLEAPALLLHHWNARDAAMVTHAVPIGTFDGPFPLTP
ncbi:MAG: phosphodiesterase [Rhodospirillum sp.]|nr:phosphodiesterase [Rhodospirillum sp.]MCF8491803.1 phosphodiesterase [Rhodospirillum sp.]MCF8501883.1 phosphodiesterase [Rhodospirillum sp.]